MLDALDEDRLIAIRDIAEAVRKGYANLGPEAAAQYIADQNLEPDEMVALWELFGPTESAMRAAIKSAQAAERLSA
jgi:hypothetical protein